MLLPSRFRAVTAFGLLAASAATLGFSVSCTAIADVSDAQCKTDSDCAKLNALSDFEQATCSAGVCTVQECSLPELPTPADMITVLGQVTVEQAPGAPLVLTANALAPASDPSITLHACGRSDPTCMRTSCGWLSPPAHALPVDAGVPGFALFEIPVVGASQTSPPFDGYIAIVPDVTSSDYLPNALFIPPAVSQTSYLTPGTFTLPRRDSYSDFAFAAGVKLDPTLGTLGILVFEGANPQPQTGVSLSLADNNGDDPLTAASTSAARIYLDLTGEPAIGAMVTSGFFTVFLNIPPAEYTLTATHVEADGQTVTSSAQILAMPGVSSLMNITLLPPQAPVDAGGTGSGDGGM